MNTDTIWNLYPLAREQLVNTKTLSATKLKSTECRALEILIESQGKVVTKDELFKKVWGNRIVSSNSLTQCIAQLRLALNDNGKEQKFIKTIPSKGYMLFENVVEIAKNEARVVEVSVKTNHSYSQKEPKNNYNYTLQAKVWCIILFTTLFIYQTLDAVYKLNFSQGVTFSQWLKREQDGITFHFVNSPATKKLSKYLSLDSKHLSNTAIRSLFISKGVNNYYLSCIYTCDSTEEIRTKNITFPLNENFYFVGVTLNEMCR